MQSLAFKLINASGYLAEMFEFVFVAGCDEIRYFIAAEGHFDIICDVIRGHMLVAHSDSCCEMELDDAVLGVCLLDHSFPSGAHGAAPKSLSFRRATSASAGVQPRSSVILRNFLILPI
jgi:hypothetical protein